MIRFLLQTFLAVVGAIWLIYLYTTFSLPSVIQLAILNPHSTAYSENYKSTHESIPIRMEWRDLEEISSYLPRAVIAAEDDTFFEHYGFDIEAIKKAMKYNWRKKRFARGASTLTQQLARNLFLSSSKNPLRKLNEFLIAIKMELTLPKERILELYVNIAEWGPGIYGAESASQYYFKKSAKHLNKTESAFLASILPSPIKWGSGGFRVTNRTQLILNRM